MFSNGILVGSERLELHIVLLLLFHELRAAVWRELDSYVHILNKLALVENVYLSSELCVFIYQFGCRFNGAFNGTVNLLINNFADVFFAHPFLNLHVLDLCKAQCKPYRLLGSTHEDFKNATKSKCYLFQL